MDCRLKPLIQRARSEPPTSLYGGKRVSTSWTPSEGRASKGALMSSLLSSKLLSKPSPSSSRSSLCFSSPSPPSLLPRSVAFPFPKRSRCRLRLVRAQDSDTVASGDGDPKPQNGNLAVPEYAPGSQKKVTGEIIRWNKITGPEKMDAMKYIEYLEREIEELNRQVARRSANGQNELLEYLKSLEPQNLKVMTIFACLIY
ncbi:hypothetical protein BHE74_00019512 [Ensete ventricosum]|nr:hypothetical protein GW17_00020782 [Ensete ventricosum]RWW72673.1 hypothetical protein BHE74_00019512 [Ensete ventricosum]RZR91186.1 hypothetical protein BHM03_00019267 [Ensete ventricosum]